jgi:hypothetical protein
MAVFLICSALLSALVIFQESFFTTRSAVFPADLRNEAYRLQYYFWSMNVHNFLTQNEKFMKSVDDKLRNLFFYVVSFNDRQLFFSRPFASA